ncbi:hypothetical protein K469DRAFT_682137 [Zopfia rhizophila CBS 207.26]|uniref:Uncharacterized protein n=1 Tax=Zopfia rhizophila CBS 207.26 TaxID=1314779 RepID=A0A6A6EXZ1_9PEZI|nr:hypothetical protein K469DRAFT_682137 [Zopfia rhizophila CBS 207.26]
MFAQSKKPTKSSKRKRKSSVHISESQTFEQELRDVVSQQELNASLESINTAPPSNAVPYEQSDDDFDERFEDNFDGIDWTCIRYCHQRKLTCRVINVAIIILHLGYQKLALKLARKH